MSVYTLQSPLNSLNGLSTPHIMVGVALVLVFGLVASIVVLSLQKSKLDWNKGFLSYIQFAYSCFIKPHERDGEGEAGQQHALESFYRAQVSILLFVIPEAISDYSGFRLRCHSQETSLRS